MDLSLTASLLWAGVRANPVRAWLTAGLAAMVTLAIAGASAATATFAFVLGVIAIGSVFMLGVQDRAWQVRLMRMMGATPHDIRMLQITSSALLCAIGAFTGVLLAQAFRPETATAIVPLIERAVVALVVGGVVGVAASYVPAQRAAGTELLPARGTW